MSLRREVAARLAAAGVPSADADAGALISYVSGSRATYAKFDGYVPRQEPPSRTAGGKVAMMDRVEWTIMPDSATAAAALQAGEIDWWEQINADLAPLLRRTDAASRARANELAPELVRRIDEARAAFLGAALDRLAP